MVRALGSIGSATLLSRILGYVRDMVVALAFGAGPVTDAFFVAFRIPNILRRLLGEGALATAVLPVFTDYAVNRTRQELGRLMAVLLAAALTVLTAVSVLGILTAPWIVRLIAPGFAADVGQWELATLLTRLMFPYLLLVGLSALAMAALQSHNRFFAAALGPAVLNVGMIGGVLLLHTRMDPPILSLAIGVLAGGLGQLMVQVPGLSREGLLVAPVLDARHPALGRIVRLLLPSVFGLAAVQVSVFVNTLLASLLPSGSISYLYYADRVMEFPLGVFGIALASAALPAMARQGAAGDTRGVAQTLNFALRMSLYIATPATVGLVLLRTPITRVLFERGQFGPVETAATLEKYAVRCGGGKNHRMGLSDAALIKDNHVIAAGGVAEAFRLVRKAYPEIAVEVEVDSVDDALIALESGADLILLDNMGVDQLREAVEKVAGRARLEASGGLTLEVAREVAETGVDYLAVGALTHSAPVLDIAMDLQEA